MEKEVVINLRTSATESVDALEQLKQRFTEIDTEAEKAGEQMNAMNKKMEMLKGLAIQAGATSPIGKKALKEAAEMQGQLDQINELVRRNNTDFDTFREVAAIGSTAINSYAAFQSVMALTGVENEKLLETMVKLQAAQQLLSSIEAARASLLQKNAIITKGMAAVQSAYSTAVGASTGALKAFRLALIATGIGALVVLIGTLVANWSSFVNWIEKSIEKFEWLQKVLAPVIWAYEKASELLAEWGVIDSEETKRMIANTEARIAAQEEERKAISDKYDFEISKAKAAGENTFELEQQKRAAVIESVKAQMEATIQLVRLTGEFTEEQKEAMLALKDLAIKTQREIVVATIAEEKKKTDEYKKELDERRKTDDESYKQQLEKEEAQWQLLQEVRLSAQELELLQLSQAYDKKFELAQGNAELEKELLIKQQQDIAAINQRFADEKLAAEWEQAQRMRDLRLEIKALNEGELDENASPEEVEAFYAKRRELEMAAFEAKMEDLRYQLETDAITNEEFLLQKELAEKQNENNITAIKKQNADAQIAIEQKKKDATAANLAATANVLQQFSSIAGEETAAGKAMAIAAATINTYRGVSDALAATTFTPFETALKFANAAAIGIAGIQNVRKIMAVQTPKPVSGGGGISLPNMQRPTTGGQDANGQNNEIQQGTFTNDLLNGNQNQTNRVVVLESDIALARNRNDQSASISEL